MNILLLEPYPAIWGPLPKILPVIRTELINLGCRVQTGYWSSHKENEPLIKKILGRLNDIFSIVRMINTNNFDVIVITSTLDKKTPYRDLPLIFATRKKVPKIIIHYHGSFSNLLNSSRNHILKCLVTGILINVDAVLLLSMEEVEDFRHFFSGNHYFLVDNPYKSCEPMHQRLNNKDVFNILFVGRMVDEKGIFNLLDAVALLKNTHKIKIIFAGDGPHRECFKKRVSELGLESIVESLGYQVKDGLTSLYKEADLFVLPSWREGFPFVLVEALDFGLPIVTTRIRGAIDRLVEGENCLFVEPQDVNGLAKAIEQLLFDADLRERMSQNNKQKVKEYAPDAVVRKYYEILKEIVEEE